MTGRSSVFVVFCGALGAATAGAQSISGIVRDRTTHAPLAHISVELHAADSTESAVAAATERAMLGVAAMTTGADGSFAFPQLRPGRYVLEFHADTSRMGAAGPYVVAADSDVQRVFDLEPPGGKTYFEFQVAKQVVPYTSNRPPHYPAAARDECLQGDVLTQFVVDTTGSVIPATIKILASSSPLFTQAVRSAVVEMKFYPAEIAGRRVRQLVQQPFSFDLGRMAATCTPGARPDPPSSPDRVSRR